MIIQTRFVNLLLLLILGLVVSARGIRLQDRFYTYNCYNKSYTSPNEAPSNTNNTIQTIRIIVTSQVTHNLVSSVFASILQQKLHYDSIQFVYIEPKKGDPFAIQEARRQIDYGSANLNPSFDIELWQPYTSHFTGEALYNVGPIYDFGRIGWFIPKELIKNGDLPEHYPYTMLMDTNISNHTYNQFSFEEKAKSIIPNNTKFYSPPHCKQKDCIFILAGNEVEGSFLEGHIVNFTLAVNVYWLGDELRAVVRDLYNLYTSDSQLIVRGKKFIVLSRSPSEIIDSSIEFVPMLMPSCEEIIAKNSETCFYELMPVMKYSAKKNKFEDVLMSLSFDKPLLKSLISEYDALLNKTDWPRHKVYDEAACKWIDKHHSLVTEWVPIKNEEIFIGGIFPKVRYNSSTEGGEYVAAEMAINMINGNTSLLPNYKLSLKHNQCFCDSDEAVRAFLTYGFRQHTDNLVGVLGPWCSDQVDTTSAFSKTFQIVAITYSAEGTSFNKQQNPYFFRTIGENKQYKPVFLQFMKSFKWKRVAMLSEDGSKYTEYLSEMEQQLKKEKIEVIVNKKLPSIGANGIDEIQHALLDLRNRNARIIVAEIYNPSVFLVICEAYNSGMTAKNGYVWFFPFWAQRYIDSSSISNCSEELIREALIGQLSLTQVPFANANDSISANNQTVAQWQNEYEKNCKEKNTSPSHFAGFAFDAVYAYAFALDKLLTKNKNFLANLHSKEAASALLSAIEATNFEGVSGKIQFGNDHSRKTNIDVIQWTANGTRLLASYFNDQPDVDKRLVFHEKDIWNGVVPSDGTKYCSMKYIVDLFEVRCDQAILSVTILCSLLLTVLFSLAIYMYWKRFYKQKIETSARVLRNFGIDLLNSDSINDNSLDKWKIPKERIVVNRKLGEGAFGTVFGGEANLNGREWSAVAVKTLKAGSKNEDRIDFLAEAEAMKRFDDKNILKLLGVCLESEPIFTIIEFMLYGDLKTYLLARRHLVNEKLTDDSEISPKRLTAMALDVSRGLSYLAEQKYVHRDIACRNCLVNAQRIVKIGDFGMARPMFDSDHYKFKRKGMLPVRWLAPESLADGLFTPASDIWSYGVLLYEIVTFGSFPYQGISNSQVLDYVKMGGSLKIPRGVKPQLENLMMACWSFEHKDRPTASDISEIISNHPRMVTPCLDVPLSSVQMPESDSLELLPGLKTSRSSPKPLNDSSFTTMNNLNYVPSTRDDLHTLQFGMNVPMVEKSINGSVFNNFNAMEPLLMRQSSKEMSKSNLSLLRYVPMNGYGKMTYYCNHSPEDNNDDDLRDYTKMSVTHC